MRSTVPVLALAVLTGPSVVAAQEPLVALQGAWRMVEVASASGATAVSEPGLLIFSGRYFSYTLVNRPRPDMPGLPTAEQLLAVWSPFSANAGTYEVSGDTMVRRPMVAKDPRAMAPGAFNEYRFRISADTLWLTTLGTETGPARNPGTIRYVRLR